MSVKSPTSINQRLREITKHFIFVIYDLFSWWIIQSNPCPNVEQFNLCSNWMNMKFQAFVVILCFFLVRSNEQKPHTMNRIKPRHSKHFNLNWVFFYLDFVFLFSTLNYLNDTFYNALLLLFSFTHPMFIQIDFKWNQC